MSEQLEANAEAIDFAVVVYREEGAWQVQLLAEDVIEDIETFAEELRRWPGEGGSLGMLSVDEDFFILLRVQGAHAKLLLSDITAATDWPIARSAVDFLELPIPEDEDEQAPAGDLGILVDLGVGPMDMGALLDDYELYPDEMLADIAGKAGFGEQFDEAVGATTP